MEKKSFLQRKKIVIFSEYNGVSVSLVEKFLANFFSVKVVCGKKILWEKYSPYLFSGDYLSITNSLDESEELKQSFLIFVSCFFDNLSYLEEKDVFGREEERLQRFLFLNTRKRKFLVLPYQVYDPIGLKLIGIYSKKVNLQEDKNLFICYVGEVVGPRVVLSLRSEALSVLHSCFSGENLFFYSKTPFLKVCRPDDFSRKLVKFVLDSKSIKERKAFFLGQKLSRNYFLQVLENELKLELSKFRKTEVFPKKAVFDKEIDTNSSFDEKGISEVVKWFRKNEDDFFLERSVVKAALQKEGIPLIKESYKKNYSSFPLRKTLSLVKVFLVFLGNLATLVYKKVVSVIKPLFFVKKIVRNDRKKESTKGTRFIWKVGFRNAFVAFFKPALFSVFLVLVFPLFLFFTSGIFLYLGYVSFKNFNLSRSTFFLRSSEKVSSVLSENYYSLARFPVVGGYYLFLGEMSSLLRDFTNVFVLGISLVKNASSLYEKSLKGEEVGLTGFSKSLFLDLNSLYFKTSLLEGKILDLQEKYAFLNVFSRDLNLSKYRREIIAAKEVSLFLPEILGEKEEKKYLVLFQNNMEIRATGGFIGSFAILTFKKGALSNFEVYDVYTADGQLKGYVEPPWQIKKYLDQPAWYLRDSNWDPDFSVSAKRAQWFLDKSIDINVDGVFSFDVSFVKDLISVIGHLNIPDYNRTIDPNIFYDVVQYEVEKDFFPGSRQKSSFLAALSKSLILEIKGAKPNVLVSFLPVFYENLVEKHLQLFFNSDKIQEKITFLGWGGGANRDFCFSENCFGDFVFLVESNFGVNKANYFVSRSANIKIEVGEDFLRREMEVLFENRAPVVLGDKGKYKNYFRIFLPADVFVEKATIQEGNYYYDVELDQEMIRGMKQVGLLVEISPESSKKVILSWNDRNLLDLSKNGEYRFFFRKQSGIDDIPLNLEVKFPSGFRPASDNLQLTKDGFFVYNQASLKTDFFTRFYW